MSKFEKIEPRELSYREVSIERYPSIEKQLEDLISINKKYINEKESSQAVIEKEVETPPIKSEKKPNKKKK